MLDRTRMRRCALAAALIATAAVLDAGDAFAQGQSGPGTQPGAKPTRAEVRRALLEAKRKAARIYSVEAAENLEKAHDTFNKLGCEQPQGTKWQTAKKRVQLTTMLLKIRIDDEAKLSPEYLRAFDEEMRLQDAYKRVLADPRTAESERFNAGAKLALARQNTDEVKQREAARISREVEHDIELDKRAPGPAIECPDPTDEPLRRFPDRFNGFYAGIQGVFNGGRLETTETLAATGVVTNRFSDRDTGFGGGITIGYAAAPFGNNVRATPFVAADVFDHKVGHTFGGGTFLGETVNFIGTAGVQLGYVAQPGLQIYALGGAALVNKEFSIDFGGPVTRERQWLWGGAVGAGFVAQPAGWEVWGRPLAIFGEYQHVFVEDGHLDRPAASPLFDYRFGNDMELFKLGVRVSLAPAPARFSTDYSPFLDPAPRR